MSKKGSSRYFGGSAKSAAGSTSKSLYVADDAERPDSSSRAFFYDDVDEFHNNREKIHLDRARGRSPVSSDEEVYKVRIESDEAEEDETSDGEDVDMRSDIEDEGKDGYLPSANAWGKKKGTFYSTDFVDNDYGGYNSESDEEAAQLEEVEARNLQKRLLEQMSDDDFRLDLVSNQPNVVEEEKAEIDAVQDYSQLDEDQKLLILKRQSPEFFSLIDEYKEKKNVCYTLKPIVDALIDGRLPSTNSLNLVRLRFEAYSNYLLNLHFYFLMKASHTPTNNHPVIDRIVHWKKVIDEFDTKCGNLEDDLNILCSKLANNEDVLSLNFVDVEPNTNVKVKKVVKHQKLKAAKKKSDSSDESEESGGDEFYEFDKEEDNEENFKRAATYEMLKNKGTTPKRKKEFRNPRVKHKIKFQKALHKKRSQVPDVKRELSKYGGEERGIKPNLVKSVKLR